MTHEISDVSIQLCRCECGADLGVDYNADIHEARYSCAKCKTARTVSDKERAKLTRNVVPLRFRISDNVLDDDDWTTWTCVYDADKDVVLGMKDVDEGAYAIRGPNLHYFPSGGWDLEHINEWLTWDSTGTHPEEYHEVLVADTADRHQRRPRTWRRSAITVYRGEVHVRDFHWSRAANILGVDIEDVTPNMVMVVDDWSAIMLDPLLKAILNIGKPGDIAEAVKFNEETIRKAVKQRQVMRFEVDLVEEATSYLKVPPQGAVLDTIRDAAKRLVECQDEMASTFGLKHSIEQLADPAMPFRAVEVNTETGEEREHAHSPTGRLHSNEPNLQNIPIRTEEGRRIREVIQAFRCGEDAFGRSTVKTPADKPDFKGVEEHIAESMGATVPKPKCDRCADTLNSLSSNPCGEFVQSEVGKLESWDPPKKELEQIFRIALPGGESLKHPAHTSVHVCAKHGETEFTNPDGNFNSYCKQCMVDGLSIPRDVLHVDKPGTKRGTDEPDDES